MKRVSGFTLIELIMVIVILGVLSAFALPRFADLSGDAETASANALEGSMRAAMNISHAAYLAAGSPTSITLEGNTVAMHTDGYPTSTGMSNAISADGYGSETLVAGTPGSAAGTLSYTVGSCTVTYTDGQAGGTPTVTDSSGC